TVVPERLSHSGETLSVLGVNADCAFKLRSGFPDALPLQQEYAVIVVRSRIVWSKLDDGSKFSLGKPRLKGLSVCHRQQVSNLSIFRIGFQQTVRQLNRFICTPFG